MNNKQINTEIRKALQGNDFDLELNEDFEKATFMFVNNEYLESLELDLEVDYEIEDVTRDKNYHNNNYEYEFEIYIATSNVELDSDTISAIEYEIKMEVSEESVEHVYYR